MKEYYAGQIVEILNVTNWQNDFNVGSRYKIVYNSPDSDDYIILKIASCIGENLTDNISKNQITLYKDINIIKKIKEKIKSIYELKKYGAIQYG